MFSYPLQNSQSVNSAFPIIRETLPRSQLGYGTNNVYPEFPPLMADGRSLIASYQPESAVNATIIKDNNIKSNWQYRKFLTENSEHILKQNFLAACNDVGYFQRFTPEEIDRKDTVKSSPYMYNSFSDTAKPTGYVNSDLKDLYLSREQLNAKKFVPSFSSNEINNKNTTKEIQKSLALNSDYIYQR